MTDAELEAEYAKLRNSQRETNRAIHELLNVLTIIKGEIDLAVDRAHRNLEEFYHKFPLMRD